MIEMTLPLPPSVNRYWRAVDGVVKVSEQGRAYRNRVGLEVAQRRACHAVGPVPLLSRLDVRLTLFPPDNRRRDLDNILKAFLDAMTAAGIWKDDSQIDELHVSRGEVVEGGALGAVIREIVVVQEMAA